MMDVFCGIGNVSRAAQELTKAAAQEGRSEGRTGAPPTHCGFDVRTPTYLLRSVIIYSS